MDAKVFQPIAGKANHYAHPELGECAFREGQTVEEFIAELEAPRPGRKEQVEAAIAERELTANDRRILLEAAIARAAEDFDADDAPAELRDAARRQKERAAAVSAKVRRSPS